MACRHVALSVSQGDGAGIVYIWRPPRWFRQLQSATLPAPGCSLAACKLSHERDLRIGTPFVFLCVCVCTGYHCRSPVLQSRFTQAFNTNLVTIMDSLQVRRHTKFLFLMCWVYTHLLIDQVRRRTKELVYEEVLACKCDPPL